MIQTVNYYCTYKFRNLLKTGFYCNKWLWRFIGDLWSLHDLKIFSLKSYNQKYVKILPLLHFDFKPMSGTVLSVTDELQPVATRTKKP